MTKSHTTVEPSRAGTRPDHRDVRAILALVLQGVRGQDRTDATVATFR
jgi:hypothetical protein